MSSAKPFSKGSAIIVILFLQKKNIPSATINNFATNGIKLTRNVSHFLFGVSAKHFRDDVSTTVSQNATTGSATLISKNNEKE